MTPQERKSTLALASIYSFRMLGLFMILPIFTIYAHKLPDTNAFLIGLALGIYGLTQACLQIPFGMASDKIGRKPVIITGLVLFALGSIVAAVAHSIDGIILGRAIQGAGAVGSTLTALVADTTKDEHRLKAMSMIGMTIGLAFVAAMILGPLLNGLIGVPGIFWLTAVLAVIGIIILLTLVPSPTQHIHHRDSEAEPTQFRTLLRNPELLRLDFGIFALHAILTASFIVLPIALTRAAGINENHQWYIYLPVLVLAFIAMVPFIIIAEVKRKMKKVFIGAIITIAISQLILSLWHSNVIIIAIILFLFFTAFTLLEASLPSLIAKTAPAGSKGTAMGIYSSSQFLGIFIGGICGGLIYHQFGLSGVLLFCTLVSVLWLIVALTMKSPAYLSSKVVSIGLLKHAEAAKVLQTKLLSIKGIAEAKVYPDEQVAYLKVDKQQFSENDLTNFLQSQGETTNG